MSNNNEFNLLTTRETRELCSTPYHCPSNMTDDEVKQSIVQDILSFTMNEIRTGVKFDLTMDELLKFTSNRGNLKGRIKRLFLSDDVQGLLDKETLSFWPPANVSGIRIRNDKAVLSAAMDLCGVWWDGYIPENRSDILVVNKEALTEAINEIGGINNLAKSLGMDLQCSIPSKTQSIKDQTFS